MTPNPASPGLPTRAKQAGRIAAPALPAGACRFAAGVRVGRALQSFAMALLLVCVCSRCFLGELPYSVSFVSASAMRTGDGDALGSAGPDRSEIARVVFAVLLLSAAAAWLVGSAVAGSLALRGGWLAIPAGLFVAWSLVSAADASDKRMAINCWLDQATILTAALLAVQVFAGRRRFMLLVTVLSAVGGALALKAAWQVWFEIPERIAEFGMYRDQWLGRFGWSRGDPQAALLESRVREAAPTGFFGLANLFASMLVLTLSAAVGLAGEKLAVAVKAFPGRGPPAGRSASGRSPKRAGKGGEIDLPIMAGVLTAAVALGIAAALVLTHGRGAIGSAATCALAGLLAWRFRAGLARHWRRAAGACAIVFLVGVAAVVAYGLARDRLPTKTMTFRWYYWTASAGIVAEHPLLGVGPGNFPAAYLKHRRAAAEEEVKMPHNVMVHAACQFGLPGGALYLATLACFLFGATRPRPGRGPTDLPACLPTCGIKQAGDGQAGADADPWRPEAASRNTATMIAVVAGVLAARYFLAGLPGRYPGAEAVFEVILPAAALGLCLTIAAWWARPSADADGQGGQVEPKSEVGAAIARLAVGAGLVAFFLHNMVSFCLWAPATALVFWTLAGACVAQTGLKERTFKALRWPVAVAGIMAVAAAVVLVCRPVMVRTSFSETARTEKDPDGKARLACAAAEVDRLDPGSSADAARLMLKAAFLPGSHPHDAAWSYQYALEAIRRDPARSSYHRLAAEIAVRLAPLKLKGGPMIDDAILHMAKAVELNPMDARLRIDYAELLASAGRAADCLRHLDAAENIDSQLFPESLWRLSDAEREHIRRLRLSAASRPAASLSAAIGDY